jgi:LysM repeat protein
MKNLNICIAGLGNVGSQLISIIERYELWKLDGSKKPLNKSKEKRVSKKKSKNAERQDQNHMVKKGDTLFSISKKYNISVSDLVKINKLNGNTISLGQSLKTKK